MPTVTSNNPSGRPTHHGLSGSRNVTASTAPVSPNNSDPANPSQDFFGLIAAAIGCLPNSTPAV
ncbi:hypothetical protein BKN37_17345 [Mycobacterium talmoniae]|uniref:Uncharacterized protein n=1 Tax=Mycobacterium talmoniae TaxID=1858794 RepID=A0A1S1NIK0_9MYCO|nr:hypothetical protein BKN37_17345 [Mycobacterium talmoniae]